MRIFVSFVFAFLLFTTSVSAQTDPCATAVQPFTVTSGSPFGYTLLMDATAPTSPTDPTPIPVRIDGFTVWVDSGTPAEVGKPTPGSPCASGSFTGRIPFSFRSNFGVAKGTHTLNIKAWAFALDPVTGAPTTTRLESAVVSVPFAAADPVVSRAPTTPQNVIIKR